MKYCCTNVQRVGSCYFEFQKGKFADKHWITTSLYLSADIFDDLNLFQIFSEAIPDFDYYGITQIDKEKWEQLKLIVNRVGGIVKDVVTEIDLWAISVYPTESVITVLGI